jgi:hypothetical protein
MHFTRTLALNRRLQWDVMIVIDYVKTKVDMSICQNPRCNNIQSDHRLEKPDTVNTGGDRPS